jgi:hypothetical protein
MDEQTNRAVDDESAVLEHGSDPGAYYPAGDETPVDGDEDWLESDLEPA